MRIAVLVMCHKNAEQVNLLLKAMSCDELHFYIHVDKKSSIIQDIITCDNITLLPEQFRVNVEWGGCSQIQAMLNLFQYASACDDYDRYWVISGQDYPIKPTHSIVEFFATHPETDYYHLAKNKNFLLGFENNFDKRNAIYYPSITLGRGKIQRILKYGLVKLTGGYYHTYSWARRKTPVQGLQYFFGANWICITRKSWQYIRDYLEKNPSYYSFYKHCNCPDESFFQTILMNSPYKNNRDDLLCYIDWSSGGSNPKVLTIDDYESLKNSNKLIGRKFDIEIDREIIRKIDLILENDIASGENERVLL